MYKIYNIQTVYTNTINCVLIITFPVEDKTPSHTHMHPYIALLSNLLSLCECQKKMRHITPCHIFSCTHLANISKSLPLCVHRFVSVFEGSILESTWSSFTFCLCNTFYISPPPVPGVWTTVLPVAVSIGR